MIEKYARNIWRRVTWANMWVISIHSGARSLLVSNVKKSSEGTIPSFEQHCTSILRHHRNRSGHGYITYHSSWKTKLRQVWKSLTIQGLRHTPERQEEQRVHKTLWCFYCKDDTTIRYTTDRLYVYNYYWTFSISNLLHCDESFQDEHYGNYGTWTSWTLAFSHVNPSQHATSDIFLPSKAFPFCFSKHDVWCTHLPWRHWLTPIMLPQYSRWVVGPSLSQMRSL